MACNILVSACLLGVNCRYNGEEKPNQEVLKIFERKDIHLIPVCPEQLGGLPTPRTPSEITSDGKVFMKDGCDVTKQYNQGASEALKIARLYNCTAALLKERSPSCGSNQIYDGTFSGKLTSGNGITADVLKKSGIKVFGESSCIELLQYIRNNYSEKKIRINQRGKKCIVMLSRRIVIMKVEERKYDIDGHILVLRTAEKEDASMLLPYLKRVCGETRFLLREADECKEMTVEQEEDFICRHINSERACLILAELDGVYIGNASFETAGGSRRNYHRADIGIALYQDYTGMGIGKKLFAFILEIIEKCGFEAAELTVVEGNNHAIHMYESFGFIETGRIPKANKYDDGTYSDDIFMVKSLK